MASPTLALPAGGTTGAGAAVRRTSLSVAVLLAGVVTGMAVAGFTAAYLSLKSFADEWPPEGADLDFYLSRTLVIGVLMASVLIEWAAYGIRKDFRGQSLAGFGFTILVIVSHLVGLWYLVDQLPFSVAEHPYGVVFHTGIFIAAAAAVVAFAFVVLTAFRVMGHQVTLANYQLLRATCLAWHVAAVAWIAVHYVLYVTK